MISPQTGLAENRYLHEQDWLKNVLIFQSQLTPVRARQFQCAESERIENYERF